VKDCHDESFTFFYHGAHLSLIDRHSLKLILTIHLAASLLCILCTWCKNHAL